MNLRYLLCGMLAAIVSLGSIQLATADIIIAPTFDARADTNSATPIDQSSDTLLAVGPISSGRFFRTYFTFDLSSAPLATDVTFNLIADAPGFFANNENNTSALTQDFILFQLAADWNGASINPSGGPLGTDLASINGINVPIGNYIENLAFNSIDLTAAYNSAVGGTLYLGLRSSQENAGVRSFAWLGQTENAAAAAHPFMSVTAIPEPTSLLLCGMGTIGLVLRRRR